MTPHDWQRALTAQVARNIEYHRRRLALSRTELANRCTELGLPTKRPALAALLDARRQTITLQELVILAEALHVSVAELVVPLHSGDEATGGPRTSGHALHVAEQLFAVATEPSALTPYHPYHRYERAMLRFRLANRRLAALSHRLATGHRAPSLVDGHPHPHSEILATEAALSRLIQARRSLDENKQAPPRTIGEWLPLSASSRHLDLPIIELLDEEDQLTLPMFVYHLTPGALPSSRLVVDRF